MVTQKWCRLSEKTSGPPQEKGSEISSANLDEHLSN